MSKSGYRFNVSDSLLFFNLFPNTSFTQTVRFFNYLS